MSLPELVQLDHRGINLRCLSRWQDGDGGPIDGHRMPGVFRVESRDGSFWDLTGVAADRFRSAIGQAAWTPPAAGEEPSSSGGDAGHAENIDPATGDVIAPDPAGPPDCPGVGVPNGRMVAGSE